MSQLSNYLDYQQIQYEEKDNNFYKINDKDYYLISPSSKKVFNKKLQLIHSNKIECDNWIFKFGGVYYWTPFGTEKEVQFNRLQYIGHSKSKAICQTHLGIHGLFELMNGSGDYKQWVKKAKFLGYSSLGICEENTLAGCMKFQQACQKENIKPILGSVVTVFRNDKLRYKVKCYVKDEEGWNSLLKINNKINTQEIHYIKEEDFYLNKKGLFLVFDINTISVNELNQIITDDNCMWQLGVDEFENDTFDKEYLLKIKDFINNCTLQPAFIKDTYYIDKNNKGIIEALRGIGSISQIKRKRAYLSNFENEVNEFGKLFSSPEKFIDIIGRALVNAEKISDQCNYVIETGNRHLPHYSMTEEERSKFKDNNELFWSIIEQGLLKYDIQDEVYFKRIKKEYSVLEKGDVIDYFLILWDIIHWTQSQNILIGIGRGSAGGSLISMLMGITFIDPIKFDLLFERFLNEGRMGKRVKENFYEIKLSNGEEIAIKEGDVVKVKRNNTLFNINISELKESDILINKL